MVDVKELKDGHPDFALVMEMKSEKLPHLSNLAYKQVPPSDVEVGSYVLVINGEFVPVDGEVSQPVEMKVMDKIPGGARKLDGMMIVKLTEEAQLNYWWFEKILWIFDLNRPDATPREVDKYHGSMTS